MKKDQCLTVKKVMGSLPGVELKEKAGGKFKFNLYMTRSMRDTSIDVLDLSARPYHSLKRVGYDTIGDVAKAVSSGEGLGNIRNCGKMSVREIMEKLFLFQYERLSAEERQEYLYEVVRLNVKKEG